MATMTEDFTPRQIVKELDKYIVGQEKAKRSVAVALRNRYRRRRLPAGAPLKDEIVPKNILMIGPTGVGKTEIARRLARMVGAPFVKVEATKFTEVGYVGRDVDSMVRDLVETSIRMVRAERMATVEDRAMGLAEARLIEVLAPIPRREAASRNPFEALFGGLTGQRETHEDDDDFRHEQVEAGRRRDEIRRRLGLKELEDDPVELEVEASTPSTVDILSGAGMEEMSINLQDLFGGMLPKKKRKRRVTVAEARKILAQEEAAKLIDMDEVQAEAVARAEQMGIIFIDELDKIAGREQGHGPDVSREGVQRDILPIVEGSTVVTKYGPVKTDHVLFIAAGAFHISKPSDLIPELQGRFPIRVELGSLSRNDFKRILTEPENALTKQYGALLSVEGIELVFTADAVDEIAGLAEKVNLQAENIGARRLHTVMERLLEDLSFEAPEVTESRVVIDRQYVLSKLADIVKDEDLSRYIL
ncbi:MAG TPA: ATP-dependent protease ATPase subunit HslU [Bacillota bacterium]|jgi:ATP-dependent HslUV protease ATP-binding subunit HslU